MKMKKLYVTSIAICGLALGSVSAPAAYIYDFYSINELLTTGEEYQDTFDLTDDGLPGALTAKSARVGFTFVNLLGEIEAVDIALNNEGTATSSLEFGIFFALWGDVSASIVGTLNDTGLLDYSINYVGNGAVWLRHGGIAVEVTETDTSPTEPVERVPDGGMTLALFGAGIVVLGVTRQRRKKIA